MKGEGIQQENALTCTKQVEDNVEGRISVGLRHKDNAVDTPYVQISRTLDHRAGTQSSCHGMAPSEPSECQREGILPEAARGSRT